MKYNGIEDSLARAILELQKQTNISTKLINRTDIAFYTNRQQTVYDDVLNAIIIEMQNTGFSLPLLGERLFNDL
jgi:hypothetical protein